MFDLSPAFWQPPRRFSCFFVGVAASSQPERAHERKNLQLWGFFSFSMQPNTPLGLFLRQRRRPRRIQKFSSTFSKVKFSSTFFKRWQVPRAAPLAAIRRWRNALCFRRIWGAGGILQEKIPPGPPFFAPSLRSRASPWGRWREAPVGALPFRFPGCHREGMPGLAPAGDRLSWSAKKVAKEGRLGGLRRPPKNPREPLVPDLHPLAPLMRSVAQD